MRSFVIAMAMAAWLVDASSAAAADAPAAPAIPEVVVQLPGSQDNLNRYLFTLKNNGILYKDGGTKFCATMNYGRAVLESQSVSGELEWVVCATPAAPAAPATPAVGVLLPDSQDNFHVYLFTLKKNGISYKDSGAKFCATMHYGRAVLESPAVPGELEWVICGFKNE